MNKVTFLFYFFLIVAALLVSSCGSNSDVNGLNFSNEGSGCANFIVYTQEDDFSLTIVGDTDSLGLSTDTRIFTLPSEDLDISINEFDGPIGNFYCDDVAGDEGTIVNQYLAVSGSAEISISQDTLPASSSSRLYEINILLKDVEFEIDDELKLIEEMEFNNVQVGWLPG